VSYISPSLKKHPNQNHHGIIAVARSAFPVSVIPEIAGIFYITPVSYQPIIIAAITFRPTHDIVASERYHFTPSSLKSTITMIYLSHKQCIITVISLLYVRSIVPKNSHGITSGICLPQPCGIAFVQFFHSKSNLRYNYSPALLLDQPWKFPNPRRIPKLSCFSVPLISCENNYTVLPPQKRITC
jgi:hypothetical protein